jgi:hypothetical protein
MKGYPLSFGLGILINDYLYNTTASSINVTMFNWNSLRFISFIEPN